VVQTKITRSIDVSAVVPLAGEWQVTLDVFLPEVDALADQPVAVCCLPGAAETRAYYDLHVEGDDSYSMARHLVDRGRIVLALDHLGVGASTTPEDPFVLSTDLMAAANDHAMGVVLDEVRAGTWSDGLPALPALSTVGVGHSMGAFLTTVQQANHRRHRGIALFGFSNRRLPEYLDPAAAAFAGDPVGLKANITDLARGRWTSQQQEAPGDEGTGMEGAGKEGAGNGGGPQPRRRSGLTRPGGDESIFYAEAVPRPVAAAFNAIRTATPPIPALTSMVPGSLALELATIDVPVFLGIGDKDMCGPPHESPGYFPASPDITLVVLPDTGHGHHLFPSRHLLWNRLETWIATVVR
jgi:pimeloyl-ACP methyl ester carboxylesterase